MQKAMKYRYFPILAAALAVCGCTPSGCQPSYEAEPTLAVPAQLQSDAFAINVFRELAQHHKGNITFSPASLESMLRLLQQGARGVTARELATLPMGQPDVRTAMQPTSANALFIGENLRLKGDIQADEIIPSPLSGNPDVAAKQINNWACDKTDGMIPSIMDADTLKQRNTPVRLIAANALALHEKWLRPFPEENTRPGTFFREDSSTSMVQMMHQTGHFRYAKGEDWLAVALFYRRDGRPGEPGCFLAILPTGSARGFAATLTADKFSSIRQALAISDPVEFHLGLPVFEQRTPTFSLAKALQACGLKHIFSQEANLSGFSDEPLFLSDVLQRCYVKADEQGVKAAAVTMGVARKQSIPTGPHPVIFDRPFIWAICDLTTPAAPRFLGLYEGLSQP